MLYNHGVGNRSFLPTSGGVGGGDFHSGIRDRIGEFMGPKDPPAKLRDRGC